MPYNRHIIFLFLCIFQISLSDSTNQNEQHEIKLELLSSEFQEGTIRSESTEKIYNLFKNEIGERESIFESSLKKAQELQSIYEIILISLALHILDQPSSLENQEQSKLSIDVLREYRDQTALNLRKQLGKSCQASQRL